MADSAPFQNFVSALMRRRGAPRVTGRPPKPVTIADVTPLPKPTQIRNPTRTRLPPLPQLESKGR